MRRYCYRPVAAMIFVRFVIMIIAAVVVIIIISIIILSAVVPGAGCCAGIATGGCRSCLRSQAVSAFSSSPSVLG